jgi:hypothetical protein
MHRRCRALAWLRARLDQGRLFGRLANRREQIVPVTITREQRDAIYELVIDHLSGIGDVWVCVESRDFAVAKRLGREFSEDLRLLEDLGWAEAIEHETVALTLAPAELSRALARLHSDASGSLGIYVSRPKDEEELAQRNVAASEALGEVLGQLAQPSAGEEDSRSPAPPHDDDPLPVGARARLMRRRASQLPGPRRPRPGFGWRAFATTRAPRGRWQQRRRRRLRSLGANLVS